MIVDNASMQAVQNLKQFDIMVLPNLYGLILSSIACGLTGGPGLYSGINYGKDVVIFEPLLRTLAKDLAGKDIVNPVAMLWAASDLLEHLEFTEKSERLRQAISTAICFDEFRTPDIGGECTTSEVVQHVKALL